jgi:hypothetical protein
MNLKLPIDRLLSDYNTFSPGAKFKFENIDTGNTLAAWQAASGMDGNSASCNPVMVDRASGDLHLDPSDQCAIDWGTSLSHVTLGDIDGDSRPQGVAWDVGADEAMPGGEPPADTTPPLRSNGQPAGALPAGTTQIDISLVSNEAALCRYSTIPGVDFDAMGSSFTVSGGTSHQETISGLQNGNAYTYYVRCQDSSANANTDDFVINFSVNLPVDITPPMISAISSSTATSQTVRITVNWTTDEPASSQVEYGTSPALGSFTAVDAVLKTQHTVLIDCLDRRTTYHFRVISADVAGNSNASASQSIRTSGKKPKGSC